MRNNRQKIMSVATDVFFSLAGAKWSERRHGKRSGTAMSSAHKAMYYKLQSGNCAGLTHQETHFKSHRKAIIIKSNMSEYIKFSNLF